MAHAVREQRNGVVGWVLEGRELTSGDRLELKAHGWTGGLPIVVEPRADRLMARFTADDGTPLVASLADDDELRWA